MDLKPRGDAHLAACALHLLLAQHPELVDVPFEWRVSPAGSVQGILDVDHPQAITGMELLAKALELEPHFDRYTTREGMRRVSITVSGRWGGAEWRSTNYATEQAVSVAVCLDKRLAVVRSAVAS